MSYVSLQYTNLCHMTPNFRVTHILNIHNRYQRFKWIQVLLLLLLIPLLLHQFYFCYYLFMFLFPCNLKWELCPLVSYKYFSFLNFVTFVRFLILPFAVLMYVLPHTAYKYFAPFFISEHINSACSASSSPEIIITDPHQYDIHLCIDFFPRAPYF